jgi:hypothetical protein
VAIGTGSPLLLPEHLHRLTERRQDRPLIERRSEGRPTLGVADENGV